MDANTGTGIACPTNAILGEVEEYCIWIDDNASIDELGKSKNYLIYPNPVKEFIQIRLTEINKSNKAEIFDGSGRLILQIDLTEKNNYINLKDLVPGIYHLRIRNQQNIIGYEKIVKVNP